MIVRNIVEIDEAKCDGCGLCVPSCEEGAIRIIDGKARVVSDTYCDGLGACLGHCPRDAISIVQRPAAAFDEAAVARHLQASVAPRQVSVSPAAPTPAHHGCPGSRSIQLQVLEPHLREPLLSPALASAPAPAEPNPSRLTHWPVQLHLVSPNATFLRDADLLLVADCVPFAFADFHAQLLDGRPVAIGCPKLDDCQAYVQKLSQIIQVARVRSITVVHMEVPCCTGLLRIAQAAVQQTASDVPVYSTVVSVRGQLLTRAATSCCH
jgi:Pyruvate/2-oxoacid:ferredoxin oxidoreductase delta subunit